MSTMRAAAGALGFQRPDNKWLVAASISFGAMMVPAGDADGMVGGVNSTTASLLMVAGLTIGYAEGVSTPSSFSACSLIWT